MANTVKEVTKALKARKVKIKKTNKNTNRNIKQKTVFKGSTSVKQTKEKFKKVKTYIPKNYFKKARRETEEQKEKRLAKTFLSKKIKQLQQYKQTPKIRKQIKELKMNRESIHSTWKGVRQFQHSLKYRKKNEITNIAKTIEQATSTELAKQVKRVLSQYNYEEIQIILNADDNLLREISQYYPEEEAEIDIRARRELRSQYIEKIKSFIEKYQDREKTLEDL